MIRLGIIFGGKSEEHDISILSARSFINAVDKTKYNPVLIFITKKGEWKLCKDGIDKIEQAESLDISKLKAIIDFAFPLLHGPYGEDGKIQGFFETFDIPYAGCDVLTSSLAMDKILAKEVFKAAGLKQSKYLPLILEDFQQDKEESVKKIVETIKFPMFVKPANMGSSIGISKVYSEKELYEAIENAFLFDERLVIEEEVKGREIESGVLGNYPYSVTAPGEIKFTSDFYDYKTKYFSPEKIKILIPADLEEELVEMAKETAKKVMTIINGAGIARVDMFVVDGEIFVNEVNTMPGFTEFSMYPKLWENEGVSYKDLIERIIGAGYDRYTLKNNRKTG